MPFKAHNLKLYPHTLITLDDRQTQNKDFPVAYFIAAVSWNTFLERSIDITKKKPCSTC